MKINLSSRAGFYFYPALLFVLVIATYWPVKTFDFINFDDNIYVTENSFVKEGITKTGIHWAFSNSSTGHWHPLTWLSHMLDCELFGLNPGAHHLVNVFFHAINSVLLFFLLLVLSKQRNQALFVAAIFALHPLRLESVAWIAERKDVLSLFFGLLALLSYCYFLKKRTLSRYIPLVFFFVCSLLSKPTLVSLPLLLLLLDYWPLNRVVLTGKFKKFLQLNKGLLLEKSSLIFLSLLMSFISIYSQQLGGGLRSLATDNFLDRIINVFVSYQIYLTKLFWPRDLAIFHPYAPLTLSEGVLALSLFMLMSVFCLYKQRRRYLTVGWAWFVITLLPMVGIVRIGGQAYADRWSYLPHIGLIIAVTWFVVEAVKGRFAKVGIRSIAILLVGGSVFYTRTMLPTWANSETVFRQALSINYDNFMAHNNLGFALEQKNEIKQALIHYQEAVRLNPTYPEALNNLGSRLARDGNIPLAVNYFKLALARNPQHYLANYNLGLGYSYLGDNLLALTYYLRVLNLEPNYQQAKQSINFILAHRASVICTPAVIENRATELLVLQQELAQLGSKKVTNPLYMELRSKLKCLS